MGAPLQAHGNKPPETTSSLCGFFYFKVVEGLMFQVVITSGCKKMIKECDSIRAAYKLIGKKTGVSFFYIKALI